MKKTISILMAILMMAVLFAGCKNISDSGNGKIEPSASEAPILPSMKPDDDDGGIPTIMPELVPSDNLGESGNPSTEPSMSPEASRPRQLALSLRREAILLLPATIQRARADLQIPKTQEKEAFTASFFLCRKSPPGLTRKGVKPIM